MRYRPTWLALIVLIVVALFALPAMAMAADDVGPPGTSTFGVDLVTFGILAGVVIAVSDYAKDMLGAKGKSAKLAIILTVGFILTACAHFYGLEHWAIRAVVVPVAAAGYYKLIHRE